jgi:threonine aldolase
MSPASSTSVRAVTHLDISRQQVEEAVRIVKRVLA